MFDQNDDSAASVLFGHASDKMLEAQIHPLAEKFVSQFGDNNTTSSNIPENVAQFHRCVATIAARKILDEEAFDWAKEEGILEIFRMMVTLGWLACIEREGGVFEIPTRTVMFAGEAKPKVE